MEGCPVEGRPVEGKPVDGRPVEGRLGVDGRPVEARDGDGRLIDGEGRLIEGDGRLVEDDGRLMDGEGRLLEGEGRLAPPPPRIPPPPPPRGPRASTGISTINIAPRQSSVASFKRFIVLFAVGFQSLFVESTASRSANQFLSMEAVGQLSTYQAAPFQVSVQLWLLSYDGNFGCARQHLAID